MVFDNFLKIDTVVNAKVKCKKNGTTIDGISNPRMETSCSTVLKKECKEVLAIYID